MPFEVRFHKTFKAVDTGQYINDCCVGGDIGLAEIQNARFASNPANEKVSQGQEDWGWYLWFWRGKAKFEVNVCFDNESKPEYRVHMIRQIKSGLFSKKMKDSGELEKIKDELKGRIESWIGMSCQSERIELE